MSITFKKALVTGATSGIGRALAHLLANRGIQVIVSGRDSQRLQEVATEIQATSALQIDLEDRSQRQKLIECIRTQLPDLVINCAGFGCYGDALSIPVERQLALVEVVATAPLELTLESIRAWSAAGMCGTVMNVSSAAGECPTPGMSVYGAAKAFLTHVSQGLTHEMRAQGIHVLVSCPGMVATEFATRAANKAFVQSAFAVMRPEYAAEEIWKQIINRKKKHIFNWLYRWAFKIVPQYLIETSVWNQINKRV